MTMPMIPILLIPMQRLTRLFPCYKGFPKSATSLTMKTLLERASLVR